MATDTITHSSTGLAIPAAGTYEIDPAHSAVAFSVRHLGLSKVKGGFESFGGTIVVAEEPTDSTVEVTIDAASFSTGNTDRDAHVTSADFLDVEQFPEVTFATTGVRQHDDQWFVDGQLVVKGLGRPVTLAVEFEGTGTDPWGGQRIAFTATTEIDREDWDITWNQALETGGFLVGKKISISIDVQAVRQED